LYVEETILALKEPKYIDDEGKTRPLSEFTGKKGEEPRLFPYNRVKVIGQSPINYAHRDEGWEGTEAHGVIIQPMTEFSSTLDEPYGRLVRMYDVEHVPVDDVVEGAVASDRGFTQVPASRNLPPSPEEVFRLARENPDAPPSPTRVKTPMDPLAELDPGDPATKSPLEA
jgi:hypothetical protein